MAQMYIGVMVYLTLCSALDQSESATLLTMPYERLALKLLENNCDLAEFDVDFMDLETSKRVAIELELHGCTVERLPYKSKIHVVLPEASDRGRS